MPVPGNDTPAHSLKAIFFGATMQDPGGMPAGSLLYLTFSKFFNVAGDSFQVTVHTKSGSGTLPQGSVKLNVPSGWTVSGPQSVGPISATERVDSHIYRHAER